MPPPPRPPPSRAFGSLCAERCGLSYRTTARLDTLASGWFRRALLPCQEWCVHGRRMDSWRAKGVEFAAGRRLGVPLGRSKSRHATLASGSFATLAREWFRRSRLACQEWSVRGRCMALWCAHGLQPAAVSKSTYFAAAFAVASTTAFISHCHHRRCHHRDRCQIIATTFTAANPPPLSPPPSLLSPSPPPSLPPS